MASQPPGDPERPWLAEEPIDDERAVRLLAAGCPELAVESITRFGEGWDNVAFFVNGQWVFRFPRRAVAGPLLEVEIRALPALAQRLPVAIPDPVYSSGPCEGFPFSFFGYRLLAGSCWVELELSEGESARLGRRLGGILRSLHDTPVEQARTWGVPDEPAGNVVPARRAAAARGVVERLRTRGAWPGDARHENALEALDPGRDGAPRTLCNGDLGGRHLLFGEPGEHGRELTGMIDWGDLAVSDAAIDIALAYEVLPPSVRPSFFETYGAVDAGTRALARVRAIHKASAVLAWALDVDLPVMQRAAQRTLGWVVEGE